MKATEARTQSAEQLIMKQDKIIETILFKIQKSVDDGDFCCLYNFRNDNIDYKDRDIIVLYFEKLGYKCVRGWQRWCIWRQSDYLQIFWHEKK